MALFRFFTRRRWWFLAGFLLLAVPACALGANALAHLHRLAQAPLLEVSSPIQGQQAMVGQVLPVQVHVRARGAPVSWVQLWVDGRLYGQRLGPLTEATFLWAWVPTQEGSHTLHILALDQANRRTLQIRTVTAVAGDDPDGDGLSGVLDACPQRPGPEASRGCPVADDADGDGLPAGQDLCPEQPGLPEEQGCPVALLPDADADGTPDLHDLCPQQPGPGALAGCDPADPQPDRDHDGLPDLEDACPAQSGDAAHQGCPAEMAQADRDGDGVPDALDECPEQRGLGLLDGCPAVLQGDMDGDGVPDDQDVCPQQAGPNGAPCPLSGFLDSDGDGVLDLEDACPEQAGAPPQGCPQAGDQDGDGLADEVDNCPTLPGPAERLGCPERVFDSHLLNTFDRAQGGLLCALVPQACAWVNPCLVGPCPEGAAAPGLEVGVGTRQPRGACRWLPALCGCALAPGPQCDPDHDGLVNRDDRCPAEPGLPELGGCPAEPGDADADGVLDPQDECPTQMGSPLLNGCPSPHDRDLDGLPDALDECPDTFGFPRHDGCLEPERSIEVEVRLLEVDTAPEWQALSCLISGRRGDFEPLGEGRWAPPAWAHATVTVREGDTLPLEIACYGLRSPTGGAYLLGALARPVGAFFWDGVPRWMRAENPATDGWMEVEVLLCAGGCP